MEKGSKALFAHQVVIQISRVYLLDMLIQQQLGVEHSSAELTGIDHLVAMK